MTTSRSSPSVPRVGMMATVRNRRALVTSVDPYDSPDEGRVHLVRVEYTDSDGPLDDTLVWEREPATSLLEPRALPNVTSDAPMPGDDFDALLRAARWTAMSPFLDPDGEGRSTAADRQPLPRRHPGRGLPAGPAAQGAADAAGHPAPRRRRRPRQDDRGRPDPHRAAAAPAHPARAHPLPRLRCACSGARRCGTSSRSTFDDWSTAPRPTRSSKRHGHGRQPVAHLSRASSPPTTTCASPTSSSSSAPPAATPEGSPTCPGTCSSSTRPTTSCRSASATTATSARCCG